MPNKLFNRHPRTYGKDTRRCRVCLMARGVIQKYELVMCRKCFRERAPIIGFNKLR
jgi:small subunit ribosomal protein S29e